MFTKNVPAALVKELRKDNCDPSACFEMLARAGASAARYQNGNRQTALMLATQRDYPLLAKSLIEKGASVAARDHWECTPLHYAAYASTDPDKVIRLLVASGANINARNKGNSTPLHLAIRYGNLPVVRLLVVLGADTLACDVNDNTPLKLIERLSRGATFVKALTAPVTEEEKCPGPKPAEPDIPMTCTPAISPAPAAKPLSATELEEMKKHLKASFRRATLPGAGTDAHTIALTAQALLTVDARLRDAEKGPRR